MGSPGRAHGRHKAQGLGYISLAICHHSPSSSSSRMARAVYDARFASVTNNCPAIPLLYRIQRHLQSESSSSSFTLNNRYRKQGVHRRDKLDHSYIRRQGRERLDKPPTIPQSLGSEERRKTLFAILNNSAA